MANGNVILTVGVTPDVSYNEFKKEINALIQQLDSKPIKIKVQFDESSINNMKAQIQALYNSIGASSGVGSSTSSLKEVTRALEEEGRAATTTASSIQQVVQAETAEAKAASDSAAQTRAKTQATKQAAQAQKAANTAIVQGETYLRKWTAAERSSNQSSREAFQALKNSVIEMKAAYAAMDGSIEKTQELQSAINKYKTTLKSTELVLKANGDATQTFSERIGTLAAKFSSWLTVSQIIMYAVHSIKQMISTSIELDSAMTQLRIVTGATDTQMTSFLTNATSLAKELGQSITDILGSIETFSRLGYSLEDASTLAEYAGILSNTAAVETSEATTGLTSIIKGYNMDVENAEHVADVLIEVGQKYAISAGELMEAFEKSGAALNATNTSFEKSAGLLAAANASVQDASTVGRVCRL